MRVHAILDPDITTAGRAASVAEEIGFHGAWTTETAHDPFLPLAVAVGTTTTLTLGTAVAVAFPRSPVHLAMAADDLHRASAGRFVLGLGSQVRAHVERRFGAEFDHPVARMRELVEAIRAVWACWHDGSRLAVDGEFYRLDLMPPMFSPGVNPHGHPPIFISAVGPRMAALAGEVADGVFVHGFSTAGYLRDVTVPAVEAGCATAGRERGAVEICRPVFVVTGRDEAELRNNSRRVRERLGFYGSTSTYAPVLEHEGWQEIGDDLRRLVRSGRWEELGDPITDDVLDALAIVAPIGEVGAAINARFEGVVDRLSFNVPYLDDPPTWAAVLAEIASGARPREAEDRWERPLGPS
jgi:probable F420-dependent oxidoreductase